MCVHAAVLTVKTVTKMVR